MKDRIRIILTLVLLGFIAFMTIMNFHLFAGPVGRMMAGEISFGEMTKEVAEGCVSDELWGKTGFIELNGLTARTAGRRMYNDTILMSDGMLATGADVMNDRQPDIQGFTDSITAFSEFLPKIGSELLYVEAPLSVDTDGKKLPFGVKNKHNENADIFLEKLRANKVHVLDLREQLSDTAEHTEQYFYRTDHHWNTDGAFLGFKLILSEMRSTFDEGTDLSFTDAGLWERHTLADWFLGSMGKRVGTLFAGTDDLIWYEPAFETEMSCAVPKYKTLYYGDFRKANIREEYIEERNFYEDNPYCVYIGGDYPIVHHRNLNAPNKKRILVIKDSYSLPFQAFMSTEFAEVDVIDPRHYKASGITEYCQWTRPDLVIMMLNPRGLFTNSNKKLGAENAKKLKTKEVFSGRDIVVEPKDKSCNWSLAASGLKPGRSYRIDIGNIEVTQGKTDGVNVVLYEWKKKKIVDSTVLDVRYLNGAGGASWSFRVPEDGPEKARYEVLVYAGLHGQTEGNGVKYSDVSFYRYREAS